MVARPWSVLAGGLLVGVAFDQLFWAHPVGASFGIFTLVVVATMLGVALYNGVRPARPTMALVGIAVLLSVAVSFRREPLTLFLDGIGTAGAVVLLAYDLRAGRWWRFGLRDHLLAVVRLVGHAFVGPAAVWHRAREQSPQALRWRRLAPLARGALIALPVVAVFGGLLASADPVFADRLGAVADALLPRVGGELVTRTCAVLLVAYGCVAATSYAVARSDGGELVVAPPSWFRPFLGATEANVVLGSVVALFTAFVAVQVRYFFGGQALVAGSDLTYAQYARRGFGELVIVAIATLLLVVALSAITRTRTPRSARVGDVLTLAAAALVGVMLVSAFQRLLLYESAFGFTRTRAYVHVLMVWLGILLLAAAALQVVRRLRALTTIAIGCLLGFAITLNVLNVDAFVARRNLERVTAGAKLDALHLLTLSTDAVPAIVSASGSMPDYARGEVEAVLHCWALRLRPVAGEGFTARNVSTQRARAALGERFTAVVGSPATTVYVAGFPKDCRPDRPG